MNHESVERVNALYNKSYSKGYRESDTQAITSETHEHNCNILRSIATSFDHKISVLDIGCGTGRYFYCLDNVKNLAGIDVSPFMIEEAKNPVLQEEITIENIELRCANISDAELPENSFDFVYSLGVLGEHSQFDLLICNRICSLLNETGIFYFTVVDINPSLQAKSTKRKIAEFIYPLFPSFMKKIIDKRWQTFYMAQQELEDIMSSSSFAEYSINRHISNAPKWTGAHFECIAHKKTEP